MNHFKQRQKTFIIGLNIAKAPHNPKTVSLGASRARRWFQAQFYLGRFHRHIPDSAQVLDGLTEPISTRWDNPEGH